MKRTSASVARYAALVILIVLGVALLIAEKVVAGCSVLVIAATVLPWGRLVRRKHLLRWTRIVAIVLLGALAVSSIASTDIRADEHDTGYAFVDKVASLARSVRDKITGSHAPGHGPAAPVDREAVAAYVTCMRGHGVTDFPDPVYVDGAPSFRGVDELDASEETMQHARASCKHLLRRG